MRRGSSSPLQLAGVPDQVPSAWHSLMLAPWRSKSGWHRTPQAASKWLLHTFWMKKPFSGGDSAGQYTTGRRKDKRRKEKNVVKSLISYCSQHKKTFRNKQTQYNTHTHTHRKPSGGKHWHSGKLLFLTNTIRKRESRKLQVVKHHAPIYTEGGRESTTQSMKLMINGHDHYVKMNCCVEITGSFFKRATGITGSRFIIRDAVISISYFCGKLCLCSRWFIIYHYIYKPTFHCPYPMCLLATNSPIFFTCLFTC